MSKRTTIRLELTDARLQLMSKVGALRTILEAAERPLELEGEHGLVIAKSRLQLIAAVAKRNLPNE